MDNLLALLKRIEWNAYFKPSEGVQSPHGPCCPNCGGYLHFGGHVRPFMESTDGVSFPICELKAAIDKLEAEQIKSKKARITGNWGDPMGPYILDLGDAENRK